MKTAKLWAKRLEEPNEEFYNFNQVPPRLQSKVREILENDGYRIQDDGTVVPINGDDE